MENRLAQMEEGSAIRWRDMKTGIAERAEDTKSSVNGMEELLRELLYLQLRRDDNNPRQDLTRPYPPSGSPIDDNDRQALEITTEMNE